MAEEWNKPEPQHSLSDEEFLEALWESEMGGWKKMQEALAAEAAQVPAPTDVVSTVASDIATSEAQPTELLSVSAESALPTSEHLLLASLSAPVTGPELIPSLPVPPPEVVTADDAPVEEPAGRYLTLAEMVARMEEEIPTSAEASTVSPLVAPHLALKREVEQHLVFSLAGTRYAIPTANVIEVGRMPFITAVPNLPSWVLGVTNRRGDIISVIDFRAFLSLESSGSSLETMRILFVKTHDEEVVTALVVDQINRIANLETLKIMAEDASPEMKLAPFLRGTCEHNEVRLAVLDMERLLQSHDVRQFESQASLN